MIDDWTSFFDAVTIIMRIEKQLGLTIEDDELEPGLSKGQLTLGEVARVVEKVSPKPVPVREVVQGAVLAEYPNAPRPLDFDVPLLEALGRRKYGDTDS